MIENVRVGVIGTGIGVAHIDALRQIPGAVVVGVCSAQAERAKTIASRFDVPRTTTDYHDFLGDGIDAVVIATPPGLHAPIALASMAAGKHVLCEKPLAATLEQARSLRDAATRAGVVHMVNHQQRFAPANVRAKALVESGYLGALALADAYFALNPLDYLRAPVASTSKADWFTDSAQGGGMLLGSAGPHLVDLLLWYGGTIAEVSARAAVTRPDIPLGGGTVARAVSAEDVFVVLARFAHGGLATIRGIPVAYHGGGTAVTLHGTSASLDIGYGRLRGATAADADLSPLDLPADALPERVALMARFIAAIRAGQPAPTPNFTDGVRVQAVLDASRKAAQTGTWIAVESTG